MLWSAKENAEIVFSVPETFRLHIHAWESPDLFDSENSTGNYYDIMKIPLAISYMTKSYMAKSAGQNHVV